jgi:hypothetical protein
MLKQGELLERGWTKAAIKRFYGEPRVEKVHIYNVGDRTTYWFDEKKVEQIEASDDWQEWRRKLDARTQPGKELPLLDAIREISHAAHRQRDAAGKHYEAGTHSFAKNSRERKETLYALKERGIVAAHKAGLLRYIGCTPQGMAVYEYGEGGMQCFHSCLHPSTKERVPVEGHPETLFVKAKQRQATVKDAEFTLEALSNDLTGYERVSAPRKPKDPVICRRCGGEGHIARECDANDGDYEDEFDDGEFG